MSAQAVGQELQQARAAAGLSLRDVTNATKIQTWVLQELEAGTLLSTMSPIYVRGFVNTYAKHLGLDPAPMIARVFPAPSAAVAVEEPNPQPAPRPVRRQEPARSAAAVAPSVRSALRELEAARGTSDAADIREAEERRARGRPASPEMLEPARSAAVSRREPTRPAPSPRPKLPRPPVSLPRLQLPSIKLRIPWDRVWDALAGLWPLAQRVGVGALGIAMLIVLVKINPLEKVSKHIAHKQASLTVADRASTSKPPVETALRVHPSQPLELVLVARQSTWISVKVDGRLVAQRQLNAGAKETWTARRGVELIVARPASIDVLLNGKSIQPLLMAHGGRLAITHQSIAPLVANAAAH